ncbi:MAG: hypothetical protein ABSA41_02195 [Terriglobia bacterium]
MLKSMSFNLKELVDSAATRLTKKRGPQNEGKLGDVVENKWRKNVNLPVLHDVVEKKQVIAFLTRC